MLEQTQQGTAEQPSTERADLIFNTSLIITALDEEQDNNEQQINFMERFINDKQTEVANLQNFLLTELQHMENWRTTNKRVQKIMVTEALPTLASFRTTLQSIKLMMAPIGQTAANFVEMVAQKSRMLLRQKQEEIKRQRVQIQCLKKTISVMKKQQDERREKGEERMAADKKETGLQLNKSDSGKHSKKQIKYNRVEDRACENQQIPPPSNHTPFTLPKSKSRPGVIEEQQSTAPCFGKTDNQRSRYEQCYNHIQESKKTIQYRCERTVMSPLSYNCGSSQSIKKYREELQKGKQGGQRKQYIKEKIKQIKIKAEGRQNRQQSPLKDRKKNWPKQ